uniref:Uncharacterized protein n=1 Tax=Neogobius melanostomus TaxID=47308 RepID=A0A8C6UXW9_9GOBI
MYAFKTVPLSNNTVSRRIADMSSNIVEQVVSKMRRAGHFALQLDEMTDVSGEAQLLAFVRYKDESDINEHVLFCKALLGKTTGKEIFQMIDSFFKEHDIEWTYCTHICTDSAAAVSGGVKGLLGQVKKVNTEIKWLHCIIHREALACKRMSPELSTVLDDAVQVINFIHSRPLNRRLFQTLCQESGTEHEQLLFHTDVRWLPRGKTLLRLYELHNEVNVFLKEHPHSLAVVFEDAEWVARLAYLADVFSKLNELNLSLQGKEFLNMYDKVKGFTKKLELWLRKCDEMDVSCFPLLQTHLTKIINISIDRLKDISIDKHSERLDWVRNPFIMSESNKNLPAVLQEQLMDLFSDRGLKMGHTTKTLTEFWCDVEKEYADLGKRALSELLLFGSTYLCEVTFSALTHIKTKHRNRLAVESSLITAVASLSPDISKLMGEKQAQASH